MSGTPFSPIPFSPSALFSMLYTLTLKDGAQWRLTSHDRDIILPDGRKFTATASAPFAHTQEQGLSADHTGLALILDDGILSATNIERGLFDRADVLIEAVDRANLADVFFQFSGQIASLNIKDHLVEAELESHESRLNGMIGRQYFRQCDAQLGDRRCGIDIDQMGRPIAFQEEVLVAGLVDDYHFLLDAAPNFVRVEHLAFGSIIFANLRSFSIVGAEASNDGIIIETLTPIGRAISFHGGPQTAKLIIGCDKSFSCCVGRFANGLNFRGFPHMPGQSAAFMGPNSDMPAALTFPAVPQKNQNGQNQNGRLA